MNFSYQTAQVPKDKLEEVTKKLTSCVNKLQKVTKDIKYETPQSFINLPFDEKQLEKIFELKERLGTPNLKYIINIGIGGSYLGTKAIYDALYGYFDILEPQRFPKMIFVDTVDTDVLHKLELLLAMTTPTEEILINAVSKSGKTIETLTNLEFILHKVSKHKDRLIITTKKDSPLWNKAKEQNINCLTIPKKISGRYSIFSPVGLFPLAMAGVDIVGLLEGAMGARKKGLTKDLKDNTAAASAALLFLEDQNKKSTNVTLYFQPELESLGKWYRQLMAESLGKIGRGITPLVSIGSTDLHSMMQLYLGGPKDKFFTLVSTNREHYTAEIPESPLDTTNVVEGKTAEEIMDAIVKSIKETFKKEKIPFMENVLSKISEKEIGEYMQLKMLEIMFLAELFDINAFDQPDVEKYKKHVKTFLEKT